MQFPGSTIPLATEEKQSLPLLLVPFAHDFVQTFHELQTPHSPVGHGGWHVGGGHVAGGGHVVGGV